MEAILGRETEMAASQLHSYFTSITTPGHTGRIRLDKQFKVRAHVTILWHNWPRGNTITPMFFDENVHQNIMTSVVQACCASLLTSTRAKEAPTHLAKTVLSLAVSLRSLHVSPTSKNSLQKSTVHL